MAARNWREVRAAANLNEDQVAAHRQRLNEGVRAYRLAEVCRRQDLTQEQVASAMDVWTVINIDGITGHRVATRRLDLDVRRNH